jgi:hypothetical protein
MAIESPIEVASSLIGRSKTMTSRGQRAANQTSYMQFISDAKQRLEESARRARRDIRTDRVSISAEARRANAVAQGWNEIPNK